MTPAAPARLFVLLASEADYAIILRRGPAKQVCAVRWNLQCDSFKLGQWLKGRIYEDDCDISPDGKHWFYQAFKYNNEKGRFGYAVLARTPYLKSIKWWPDSLVSAAFFKPNGLYILTSSFTNEMTALDVATLRKLPQLPTSISAKNSSEIASWKMQRNGWTHFEDPRLVSEPWKKSHHHWELTCFWKRKWGSERTYSFQSQQSEKPLDTSTWQWADIRNGRLLWASEGKIFAAQLHPDSHDPIQELIDLNSWQFEPVKAPY